MVEWSNAAVSPPPAKRRGPASFKAGKTFCGITGDSVWCTYILQSESNGCYYVGHTEDLTRRLREHNGGKTRSLKAYLPVHIVYSEDFSTKQEAFRRERQIKKYKGGEAFKRLVRKK
jgi:putative endonuclease